MAQRSVSLSKDALRAFEVCLTDAETKGGPFLRDRIVVEAIQLLWVSLPNGKLCNCPRGIMSDPERPGSTLYEFVEGSFRGTYSASATDVTILSMSFSEYYVEMLAVAERAA